jgi:hypothetical protein
MVNLLGEHIISADEIADALLATNHVHFTIAITPDTIQGFQLYTEDGLLKERELGHHLDHGMYSIHKNSHCLYVGESGTSIGTRLSRWIKEINQKCRSDENHSAAKKYRAMWGNDLSGMTVRIYSCKEQNGISRRQIERSLIRKLNPLLNVKGRRST